MSDRYLKPFGKAVRPSFEDKLHGWPGEVNDLRKDTEDAFSRVAADIDLKVGPSVANLAALAALTTQGRYSASTIFVRSVKDIYFYDTTAVRAADGITVIQPASGNGKWIRLGHAHPDWQAQTTWYIDGQVGNDENTGADAAHPLKSFDELQRRGGAGVPVNHYYVDRSQHAIDVSRTIYVSGNFAADTCVVFTGTGGIVEIRGVPRSIHQSTVTEVLQTDKTPGVDRQLTVTDSALGADGWAPYVGKMIRRLDGGGTPRSYGWVMADLGNKTARVSDLRELEGSVWSGYGDVDYIQVGERYEIVDLPFVPGITLKGDAYVNVFYLDMAGPNPIDMMYAVVSATQNYSNYVGCTLSPMFNTISLAYAGNCLFKAWATIFGTNVFGCLNVLGVGEISTWGQRSTFQITKGITTFIGNTLIQRSNLALSHQCVVDADDIGIFDCDTVTDYPQCTLMVSLNSTLRVGRIWGQGNLGPGINVRDSNCWLAYTVLPQLQTAHSTKLLVHGVTHALSELNPNGVVDNVHHSGCIPG